MSDAVLLMRCGSCQRDLVLRADLTVASTVIQLDGERARTDAVAEPCEECRATMRTGLRFPGEPMECDYIVEAVPRLMEFCGCGEPERVTELAMRHLEALENRAANGYDWDQLRQHAHGDAGVFFMIAYICDHIGWTEHGSAIGAAWLTDDGKAALKKLRERFCVAA